ncbi:hypothetical protein CHUAL_005211 [Chamberlinius hualienensis]
MKLVLSIGVLFLGFVACMPGHNSDDDDDHKWENIEPTCTVDEAKELFEGIVPCFPKRTFEHHTTQSGAEDKGHKREHYNGNCTTDECKEKHEKLCECINPNLSENEKYTAWKSECGIKSCAYDKEKTDCMKERMCPCLIALKDANQTETFGGHHHQSHDAATLYSLM